MMVLRSSIVGLRVVAVSCLMMIISHSTQRRSLCHLISYDVGGRMHGCPYLHRCKVRSRAINRHLLRYVRRVSTNHGHASLIIILIYLLLFPSLILHLWYKRAPVSHRILFIDSVTLSVNHIKFETSCHRFEIVFSILLLIELLAKSVCPLTACLSCYGRRGGFPPVMMRRGLQSTG